MEVSDSQLFTRAPLVFEEHLNIAIGVGEFKRQRFTDGVVREITCRPIRVAKGRDDGPKV